MHINEKTRQKKGGAKHFAPHCFCCHILAHLAALVAAPKLFDCTRSAHAQACSSASSVPFLAGVDMRTAQCSERCWTLAMCSCIRPRAPQHTPFGNFLHAIAVIFFSLY